MLQITERDILKQLAKRHSINQQNTETAKENFEAYLQMASKVFTAFAKSVQKTVQEQGKSLDTQLIGVVQPFEGTVRLLPSPEFVEAGRFKLHPSLRNQDYKSFYQSIKADVFLSFKQIAQVCNTTAEYAESILSDFFKAVIESNRKTKKLIKVQFGQKFGSIVVLKNGEIRFESFEEPQTLRGDALSTRDTCTDAGSILDGASAILSQGGGHTLSVKSGFLTTLTCQTPKSFFSKRSTKQNDNLFLKYRAKSKPAIKDANDIFEAKHIPTYNFNQALSATHQSFFPLNKMTGSEAAKSQVSSDRSHSFYSSHPRLQAYIERGMGKRHTKKFKFQKEDPSEYKETISLQMMEKNANELIQKVDQVMEEQKFLRENMQKLQSQRMMVWHEKAQARQEFDEINKKLKLEKLSKENSFKADKEAVHEIFFPFTHGDAIEKQREDIKRETLKYLTQKNQQFNLLQQAKSQQNKEKARQQQLKNEQLMRLRLENQKLADQLARENYEAAAAIDPKMRESDPELEKLYNEAKGNYLLPEWPNKNKFQYQGVYAQNQRFGNMDKYRYNYLKAMKKREDELKFGAMEKQLQRQEFEDGIEYETLMSKKLKEEKQKMEKENQSFLTMQAMNDTLRKTQEQIMRMSGQNPIGDQPRIDCPGPTPEFQFQLEKLKQQKFKADITDQMGKQAEQRQEELKKEISFGQQLISADLAQLKEYEEKLMAESKQKQKTNAKAWIDQTNLKYQAAQVDAIFN